VVEAALARHRPDPADVLGVLAAVGGLELCAIAGAALGAAARRAIVVVDGFIATAAVACAVELVPALRGYLVAAHRSVEPGHAALLEHLRLRPLLDLDMRLGEGSGAAVAMPLLAAAVEAFRSMATFDEAGVSEQS
jgi:nicotinate-nucleotide--dimethylbenzimidazole phosphoribosyltransferase